MENVRLNLWTMMLKVACKGTVEWMFADYVLFSIHEMFLLLAQRKGIPHRLKFTVLT